MCLGQILFKKTATEIKPIFDHFHEIGVIKLFFSLVTIPYFCIALLVYALATFYWLYLLQKIPLSIAYPFTALAMVIIPVLSIIIFNEKLSLSYWMGAILIVAGICVISFKF